MKQTPRFENKTSSRNYIVVLAYSRIGSLNNSKNTLIGNSPHNIPYCETTSAVIG